MEEKIYISPSNQPSNLFAVGNTTEKAQMEALAKIVQDILKGYQVQTVMASLHLYIGKAGRPTEAKKLGASFYFAIHSNAGSGGTGRGAVVLYNPKFPKTKVFAEALVAELNAISPHGENRSAQVADGMKAYGGDGYGEIRSPGELEIPSVILEVDFHDNPITARYIIDNKPSIAAAIVRAMVKTFGLKPVSAAAPEVAPVTPVSGSLKIVYPGKDGVNARKKPDFSAGSVDHAVHLGDVFTVVGVTGDGKFYKLKSGLYITTSEQYVQFTAKAPEPSGYRVKITATALNVRTGPGTAYKIVQSVKKGDVYTIVEEKDGWGKLLSGAGWISLKYTEKM